MDIQRRWVITGYHHSWVGNVLHILVQTDVPVLMFLMHTEEPTRFHNRIGTRRGLSWPWNPDICFAGYQPEHQTEPGATIEHHFTIPGWEYCHTKYWIFFGWQFGLPSDSTSNIFHAHFETYRSDESMRHTDLTHKEVAGEIDHAHHSVTPRKMLYPWLWSEFPYTPTAAPIDAYQVANKKYVDDHVPPEAQGFRIKWSSDESGHSGYGGVAYNHDAIRADINYNGDVRGSYSTRMYGWNFVEDHKMSFWAQRGVNAAGTIHAFAGMQDGDRDIFAHWTQTHIGFEHSNNRLYATNGDGAARTVTDLGAGVLASRAFLSWVRLAGKIEYFVNGLLVATHNTNLPGGLANLFFNFRCQGTFNAPRHISIGCPLYASPQQTFSLFPFTPIAAPSQDYHVANKKYVDDTAGGPSPFWAEIDSQLLAAPAGSITFDAISNTYRLLKVHAVFKTNADTTFEMRLNDITAAQYTTQRLRGSGANATAVRNANTSRFHFESADRNYPSILEMVLSSWDGSSPTISWRQYKGKYEVAVGGGTLWGISVPISKIYIYLGAGNTFNAGSFFHLAGHAP